MKRTFKNLGGLQSLLFCAGIYIVTLFFAIFICSSVFYAFNPKKSSDITSTGKVNVSLEKTMFASVGK